MVVEGRCRVKKVLDVFSFKDGRDLKIFQFYWEGSGREICRGKKSSIVLNDDVISQ